MALQVGLAEPGELRLASTGTGGDRVTWSLDGQAVAWTDDHAAATLLLPAGEQVLWATTANEGAWQAMARLAQAAPDEARYVGAWTARHDAVDQRSDALPAILLTAAAGVVALRRSLLEGPGPRWRA